MCKGIAVLVYLKNGDWNGLCTGISSHDELCREDEDLRYGKIEPYRFELLYPGNLTYDRSLDLHNGQGINKEQPEQAIWDVAFQVAKPFFMKHTKEQLQSAYLSKANLSEAYLSKANLPEANLSWANLSKANLSEANLSKANLSKANLSWANLSKANLSKANLSWAYLSEANLSWANLSEANLSWAYLSKANLPEAYLSKAQYNQDTRFPEGFDPIKAGMVKV